MSHCNTFYLCCILCHIVKLRGWILNYVTLHCEALNLKKMSQFDIVDDINSVLHYDTKGLTSTFSYGYSIKTLLIWLNWMFYYIMRFDEKYLNILTSILYQTTTIESNMIDFDVMLWKEIR
jgi:hypothetical protein